MKISNAEPINYDKLENIGELIYEKRLQILKLYKNHNLMEKPKSPKGSSWEVYDFNRKMVDVQKINHEFARLVLSDPKLVTKVINRYETLGKDEIKSFVNYTNHVVKNGNSAEIKKCIKHIEDFMDRMKILYKRIYDGDYPKKFFEMYKENIKMIQDNLELLKSK